MRSVYFGFRQRYSMPCKRILLPVKFGVLAGHNPVISVCFHQPHPSIVRCPMSEAPEPVAAAAIYTSIQPAGGPYKANSIKEGFICAGIWAALSIVLVVSLTLWGERAHPEKGVLSAEDWGHTIG